MSSGIIQDTTPAPEEGLGTHVRRRSPSLLVGILSDTHGQLDSAIVDVFAGVNHIIHAGDVGDRDVLETLAVLAPVTAVRGNCDGDGWTGLPEAVSATFRDLMLHVRHDLVMAELLDAPVLAAMQRDGRGVVVSGHTHVPVVAQRAGVLFLNPGSASLPRYDAPRSVALLRIDGTSCTAEIHVLGSDLLF